jgi:PLD-like domain
MRSSTLRWLSRLIVLSLLVAWISSALWHSSRRLPPGMHIAGAWQTLPAGQVRFLRDLSFADASGAPLSERQIDAELETMIAQARNILVLDAGLFGDLPAAGPRAPRLRVAPTVAAQITDSLLRARQEQPNLQILLLVDPSSVDMRPAAGAIDRLRAAGIHVVVVRTQRLRAANAAFVAFWQLCCGWWSDGEGLGSWPNPIGVGPTGVAMGLWGSTPPYVRSHRQMMIADDGSGNLQGLIFSRPLNAEAALHSSSALRIAGPALESALESEFAVAQFSGWSDGGAMQAQAQRLVEHQRQASSYAAVRDAARARVVSEQLLSDQLIALIGAAGRRDSIEIAALYLSQRELVRSLLDAARRGVTIRVLLDPNKDGYGFDHSGLPNRVVASELVADSDGAVRVRWYRTHGEQFSPGVVLIRSAERSWLVVGTADLSRRDLNDFNLAAAFITELPSQAAAATEALSWFETLWFNRASGGIEYSSDADVYADASQVRYWQYRLMEASGSAFE